MPMNVNDVYTFNLVSRNARNELAVNTFAFQVAEVVEPDDEDTILSSLFNFDDGAFKSRILDPISEVTSEALTFIHWDVQKVSPTVMQPRRFAGSIAGQVEGTPSTYNTSVSVTRYGDEGGRRNRGRIALGGMPDEYHESGIINSSALLAYQLVAANIVGTYTALASIFVLRLGFWVPAHSAIVDGVPTTYPAKFTHCKRVIVHNTTRVQRSRTIGVGR